MTELQFLIKLLLDCELSIETKALVADRIREVENKITTYNTTGYITANSVTTPVPTRELSRALVQAPSTQRLLEQNPDLAAANAYVPNNGPLQPAPQPIKPIPVEIDKETGKPMISTGGGTKGPRKW